MAAFAIMRGVTNRGARLIIVGDGTNDLARHGLPRTEVVGGCAGRDGGPGRGPAGRRLRRGAPAPELGVLRAALAGKAQFVGMAPGVNTRGLAAAGLAKSANLSGAKALYILASDDHVADGVAQAAAAAQFVVFQGSYRGAGDGRGRRGSAFAHLVRARGPGHQHRGPRPAGRGGDRCLRPASRPMTRSSRIWPPGWG